MLPWLLLFCFFVCVLYHPVSLLSRWRGAGIHGRGFLLLLRIWPRFGAFPRRRRCRGPFWLPWQRRRCRAKDISTNRHPTTHSGHKKHPGAMVWLSPSKYMFYIIALYPFISADPEWSWAWIVNAAFLGQQVGCRHASLAPGLFYFEITLV